MPMTRFRMPTTRIASGASCSLLTVAQGSGCVRSAALYFHSMRILSCTVYILLVLFLAGCKRGDVPSVNRPSSPRSTNAAASTPSAGPASFLTTHMDSQNLEAEAKKRPTDARALARWGSYLAQRGQYTKAIPFLKRAIALKPNFVAALHNLAICYENLGRIDLAAETLEREVRIAPNLPREQIKLGYLYVQLERMEEAEKAFEAARHLMPQSSEPLVALASVRYADYHYEEAEKLLKDAISINPLSAAAYTNLGGVYFATSRLDQAEEALRKSIALQENSAAAWEMLGRVQAARGGPASQEQALRSLEKAVELSPTSAQARYYLGNLYLRKGMWIQAEKNLRESVRLNPYDSSAWIALGRTLRHRGQTAEADYVQKHGFTLRRKTEEVRQILSRNVFDVNSYRRLAQLYMELGKPFHSLYILKQALQKYPHHKELTVRWKRLRSELSPDEHR